MNNDTLQRFLFQNTQIRGAIVHLDASWQAIVTQHDYPTEIASVLSEVLSASVLVAHTLKFDGQLILQIQNEGPLRLLVAKCNHKLEISGVAQWQSDTKLGELNDQLQQGQLVMTLLQDNATQPYQSIVPLRQQSIAESLEAYFLQSEQLPTKFWFSVQNGRAMGLLLQLMPEQSAAEKNSFNLRSAQMNKNLLDNKLNLSNTDLLQNLFPEDDIELFEPHAVSFNCSCSVERMQNAIRTMGKAEAEQILSDHQTIDVTCEFCNKQFSFDRSAVELIFNENSSEH